MYISNFSYKSGMAHFSFEDTWCDVNCELYSDLLQNDSTIYNFECKLKIKRGNSNTNSDINYIVEHQNNIICVDFDVYSYKKILNKKLNLFINNYPSSQLYLNIYVNDEFKFKKPIILINEKDKFIWKIH